MSIGNDKRVTATRAVQAIAAGLLGAALLTACSGSAAQVAVGVTSARSSSTSTTRPVAATAPVTRILTSTNLTAALVKVPAGSTLAPQQPQAPNGALTLTQFMAQLYADSPSERGYLTGRGFVTAATRTFNTAAGAQVSFYLIAFSSPSGAQSEALGTANAKSDDLSGDTHFAVPQLTDGVGYEVAALDSYGNTATYVYGAVGNVAIILHVYSPAHLIRTEVLALVGAQASSLRAAQA